ncbi:uncharacterized protein BP5553_07397 [Venustampulla echinocandica]|uniref:MARVEL domain-containing protein n=1 Tax=Venustampulla echinocandica TaxID=2656787 RepID=A0A370TJE0_9HELO|nr:uncharacterized protein BP5553_07397 [Venustampulla echinocandica]RDL35466.1 hypothetical protein BP5553_07397 [Venustampulla echinocandica]
MPEGNFPLKSLSWFLRLLEFCCAVIILGIFSYFISVLSSNGIHVATYIRAVEGIAAWATGYTLIALLLVCCLGGIAIFSSIALVFDVALFGAFIYMSYATRGGNRSCRGYAWTPLGAGNVFDANRYEFETGEFVFLPSLRKACRLDRACFVLSILAVCFFFFSAIVEGALIHTKRKKRALAPSPNNGYTAETPHHRFWKKQPTNVEKGQEIAAVNHKASPSNGTEVEPEERV